MLTIRLQRRGKKKDPSFRVIVVDSKKGPKTGKYLEMIGSYDARTDRVDLERERITHWIRSGAQVSDTVHNLLISQKIIEGKKIPVHSRKTGSKKDLPAQAGLSTQVKEVPVATPEAKEDQGETVSNDVAAREVTE